jgi:hypothetical protein
MQGMHQDLSALLSLVATACRGSAVATVAGVSAGAWPARVTVRGTSAGWSRPTPAICPAVEVEAETAQATQQTYSGEEVVATVRVTVWAHRFSTSEPLARVNAVLASCMQQIRANFSATEGGTQSDRPIVRPWVLGVSITLTVRQSQEIARA